MDWITSPDMARALLEVTTATAGPRRKSRRRYGPSLTIAVALAALAIVVFTLH